VNFDVVWFLCLIILLSFVIWELSTYRKYKLRDGKLIVRHGLWGRWLDLKEHLQKEHKEDKA
jgi:hypothetical protein